MKPGWLDAPLNSLERRRLQTGVKIWVSHITARTGPGRPGSRGTRRVGFRLLLYPEKSLWLEGPEGKQVRAEMEWMGFAYCPWVSGGRDRIRGFGFRREQATICSPAATGRSPIPPRSREPTDQGGSLSVRSVSPWPIRLTMVKAPEGRRNPRRRRVVVAGDERWASGVPRASGLGGGKRVRVRLPTPSPTCHEPAT
jgi:hypothetical protein